MTRTEINMFFAQTGAGQTLQEQYNLKVFTELTSKIPGDIAEVGVYTGGSALVLWKFKHPSKRLYLFDTFEGVKDASNIDMVNNGFASCDMKIVSSKFSGCLDVEIHKCYFPSEFVNQEFDKKSFSLVHLDIDTYQSTLNCLVYFYRKMSTGGIVITHDHDNRDCPGIKKAFDEFLDDKPEDRIILCDTQAMIVKI